MKSFLWILQEEYYIIIHTSEREIWLNTTDFPNGVYFLKFTNEYGDATKKLIIKN